MSTSTPYDHTTPPPTPHASSRPSNLRSNRNDGVHRRFFSPLRYRHVGISTCPANSAYRDGRTKPRDDIRFVYKRYPKHLGNEIAASNLPSWTDYSYDIRFREELEQQQKKKQNQDNIPKEKPSLIGDLQDVVPQNLAAPKTPKTGALAALRVSTMMTPAVNTTPNSKSNTVASPNGKVTSTSKRKTTPNPKGDTATTSKGRTTAASKSKTTATSKNETTATPEASPKPKVPAKLKDTWSSFVGWQPRSSDIFRGDFSFSTSSRRRCDQTPSISPRTSISSSSGSPTLRLEYALKRLRVNSSGATVTQTASRNGSLMHNVLGYSLSPTPTSPANIWVSENIRSPRPVATSTEPHPGFPVDFTRSSSQRRKQSDDDEHDDYHEYLDDSKRNNSSPDESPILFTIDIDDHKPSIQAEPLNKETRILGLSSNPSQRKRSDRTPHTPSSSSAGSSSAKTRASSIVSDPSMDRFLEHVRASQEKRAAKARVEDVKRWLGTEPL